MTGTERAVKVWMRDELQRGRAPKHADGGPDLIELGEVAADEFSLYWPMNGTMQADERLVEWAFEVVQESDDW